MKNHKIVMIVAGIAILTVVLVVVVMWRITFDSTSDRCYVLGMHAGAPAGCPQ